MGTFLHYWWKRIWNQAAISIFVGWLAMGLCWITEVVSSFINEPLLEPFLVSTIYLGSFYQEYLSQFVPRQPYVCHLSHWICSTSISSGFFIL